jgi:DNA primase
MLARGPRFITILLVTTATLAAGTAGVAASYNGKATYRWVDDQGVVHYGDTVPPQYAQKEHTELNAQGVEIKRLDAEKTPEQAAVAAHARQALLKQKQHDSFLLTTYTSVGDIEALRDERLQQLKAQRTAAEAYVESLHSRLATLQTRAMMFRPYSSKPAARRMPDDLTEDLVRTLNEMRTQSAAIVQKGTEETTLRSEFQADIERYQELHAVPRPR